jgi:hypothetical protein
MSLAAIRRSWSAYYRTLFPDDRDFPPKKWMVDVAGYMFERGYDQEATRCVLRFATHDGSVQDCPDLAFCDFDRDHVESLLPPAPESEWARTDGYTWKLSN